VATAIMAASKVPPDLADKLKGIGPAIEPDLTWPLYAPLHASPPYSGVTATRDIAYGPDPLQALDLFSAPSSGGAARPVLILVHGGAFVAGDKSAPGSFAYDNVMLWAVQNGMVGVNINYRLAPQHAWPTGAADTGLAIAWVKAHIAEIGGDPDRLYLMGHSAGAVHVGDYIAFETVRQGRAHGLAGAILVSGLYDFTQGMAMEPYHGADAALYAERSCLSGLVKTPLPVLLFDAELDPPPFLAQAEQLNAALTAAGRPPTFVRLKDHSHISEMLAINTGDTNLTEPLARFVHGG
jgi:acetyl esterase/lipase